MRVPRVVLIAATLTFGMLVVGRAEAALHPGDKITVQVYNHPELSGDRTIDAAGNVSLPVAGTISALGVEPDVLAARVEARLASYIRYAAVSVQLDEQNAEIFIAGGAIGVVPYAPGLTVASIVDQLAAPTLLPQADTQSATSLAQRTQVTGPVDLETGPVNYRSVHVIRDGKTLGPFDVIALRAAGDPGPVLMPNDTVALADKPIAVTVTGEVQEPRTAYLNPTEPLSAALSQAGGLDAVSRETNITLVRDGTPQLVTVGSLAFAQPAQNGDRIIVPRAPRVDVIGVVTKPGETLLRGSDTLVSAIYYAGGPDKYANLRAVSVIHDGTRKQYDLYNLEKGGTKGANPQLSDGDVVQVPQGSTFDVSNIWNAIGALAIFGLHI